MTKLTKKIQHIGRVYQCEGSTDPQYAISYLEAIAIRDKMKQLCIDAVMKSNYPENGDAIKAILEIK